MPRKKIETKPISIYTPPPCYAMTDAYLINLPRRTGKTLEEWIDLIKETGPPTEKERREWLKQKHGISTNYAWWLAERATGKGGIEDYDPEELVNAMFAGAKAGLRPLYEAVLKIVFKLGPEVKVCPGKTIIPFYRNHVFAQVRPVARTRLDLGLAVKDLPPRGGRLIETGGRAKGDRLTYRIPITALEDIDAEVPRWLKVAYDLDA